MVRLQRDRDDRPCEDRDESHRVPGRGRVLLGHAHRRCHVGGRHSAIRLSRRAGARLKAYGTAHGELLGAAAPGFPDNLREFDGPDSLGAAEPQLLLRQPDVPASCATEISPRLISSAARYPPWYYGLVGTPVAAVGSRRQCSRYRLVSAVLCVGVLTLAMLLAKRSPRPDVAAVAARRAHTDGLVSDGVGQSQRDGDRRVRRHLGLHDHGWQPMTSVGCDWLMLASFLAAVVVLMRPISIVWMAGTVVVVLIGTAPHAGCARCSPAE